MQSGPASTGIQPQSPWTDSDSLPATYHWTIAARLCAKAPLPESESDHRPIPKPGKTARQPDQRPACV